MRGQILGAVDFMGKTPKGGVVIEKDFMEEVGAEGRTLSGGQE